MQLYDYSHTLVLMDGRRLVAKAKKSAQTGEWLLKLYGGCWTDEKARAPNRVTGKAAPEYMMLKSKKAVMALLKNLRDTGSDPSVALESHMPRNRR